MSKARFNNVANYSSGTSFSAVLGIVAIVLLQVSVATHQFEHAAEENSQYCHVCVTHDRQDDVVPDLLVSLAESADWVFPDVATPQSVSAQLLNAFRSRAPPLVS